MGLTEEARRDRQRRLDLGDETAKLKINQPTQPSMMPPAAGPGGIRPPNAQQNFIRPGGAQQQPWYGQNMVRNATHVYRPQMPAGGGGWPQQYGGGGGWGQRGGWPGR